MNLRLLLLILLTFLARVLVSFFIPIMDDEAYYWVWSHFPSLSYFDHPGMIAWLIWLGRHILPWSVGFRLPGILLSHIAIFLWYDMIQKKWSRPAANAWLGLAFLHPLLGVGHFLQTPDLPLFFFNTLAIYAFDRYLRRPDAKTAALVGASLGLGFCSKYHIVLLVPILFLTTLASAQNRKLLRNVPHLLVLTLTGFAFSLPVLIWNATHDWVSFRFQLHHGLGQSTWEPEWTYGYLLGQIAIFNPFLLGPLVVAIRKRRSSLFANASLFTWAFFLLSSFRGLVEANWPSAAFAPAYALTTATLNDRSRKSRRWLHGTSIFWGGLFALALTGYRLAPAEDLPERFARQRALATFAQELASFEPLFASNYQYASLVSFHLGKIVPKLAGTGRTDFYDFQNFAMPDLNAKFYFLAQTGENLPAEFGSWRKRVLRNLPADFVLYEVTP